jgi:hypothetical protein
MSVAIEEGHEPNTPIKSRMAERGWSSSPQASVERETDMPDNVKAVPKSSAVDSANGGGSRMLPARDGRLPVSASNALGHAVLLMIWATLTSSSALKLASPAVAEDMRATGTCAYQHGYNTQLNMLLTPSNLRLGTFRVELELPDFSRRATIQSHLRYSAILSQVLMSALPRETRGLCQSYVDPSYFPDLYVYLKRKNSFGILEEDRSFCSNAFLSAIQQAHPDMSTIARAAFDEEKRALAVIPHSEAVRSLWTSLASIYERDSALNALTSVKPSDFRSIDADDFIVWLDRQKKVRRDQMFDLPACESETDRQRSLHSGVVPRGVISVFVRNDVAPPLRALRHLVVLRGSQGVDQVATATREADQVCTKEVSIRLDNRPGENASEAVRIKCVGIRPFHVDDWLAFYCDPQDCQSEGAEQAAMSAIVRYLGALVISKSGGGDLLRLEPYEINIEQEMK